jgi:hypothetical protein
MSDKLEYPWSCNCLIPCTLDDWNFAVYNIHWTVNKSYAQFYRVLTREYFIQDCSRTLWVWHPGDWIGADFQTVWITKQYVYWPKTLQVTVIANTFGLHNQSEQYSTVPENTDIY